MTVLNYLDFNTPPSSAPQAPNMVLNTTAPPPPPSLTPSQLLAILAKTQTSYLATGITVNVADAGEPAINILCDGTDKTQSGLGLLAAFGQTNPTGTKVWEDNNGVFTPLTGTQLISLATQIGNWVTDTYAAKQAFAAQIVAGTVTTRIQIAALVWPAI